MKEMIIAIYEAIQDPQVEKQVTQEIINAEAFIWNTTKL